MRILQVNKLYAPWQGGVETVVRDIAEMLSKRGHTVDVLVCSEERKQKTEVIDGIRVEKAASFGLFLSMPVSFDIFSHFRRMAKEYDLILLHHPFPLGFLAHLFFDARKPVAVWYHADITRQRFFGFLLKPVIWAVLREAQCIFVSGRGILEHSSLLRRFRAKCQVIPFGVDLAWATPTPALEQQAQAIRKNDLHPLIFAFGRAVSYKGFEYLIDAVHDLPARVVIAGEGPLLPLLKKRAAALRLEDRIVFPGYVSDPRPYYMACDIFALPSVTRAEAFGIVQAEAMAFGKPVVNTSLPTAVPDVSIHGETGLTVPPRDVAALRAALRKLIDDPALRRTYGEAARRRAEKEFSKDVFAARVEEALTRCLTPPGSLQPEPAV